MDEKDKNTQQLNELLDENSNLDNLDNLNCRTDIKLSEFVKSSIKIGIISFGGELAQITLIKDYYVFRLKWISEERYMELLAFCQTLPGSTSTQLLVVMGTIFTSSKVGGIVAFLIFAIPSSILMVILGILCKTFPSILIDPPDWFLMLLHGLQSATVSIIGSSFLRFAQAYINYPVYLIIIIVTCSFFMLYQNVFVMLVLFLLGAVISFFFGRNIKETKGSNSQNKQMQFQSFQLSIMEVADLGKVNFVYYIIIFLVLLLFRLALSTKLSLIGYSFYYIASATFGQSQVVLPLILEQFKKFNMITSSEFWNGFAIISSLPGPLFNISAYVGSFAGGIVGGILGWITIFLPSFFIVWGALPYWNQYSNNTNYQKIFQGLGATSVGFIASATILLWIQATNVDPVTSSLIIVITFTLYHIFQKPLLLVMAVGGALAVSRYFLLILFRGVDPHSYMF